MCAVIEFDLGAGDIEVDLEDTVSDVATRARRDFQLDADTPLGDAIEIRDAHHFRHRPTFEDEGDRFTGRQYVTDLTTEGQATIVEFIDFQCPFCRRQHATLTKVLEEYGERVRVLTHHLPMDRIHPQAREAARVACCAEEQGKDEAVIHALMVAEDLSPQGCRDTAVQVGVDGQALSTCLESNRPDERLSADAAQAKANGVRALPTVFIGGQRFQGARDEATLRNAIERALAGSPTPT